MSSAARRRSTALWPVAVAVLFVSGCALEVDLGDGAARRVETISVPAEDVRELEITTDNGRVEVSAGAVDEVAIRAVIDEDDEGDAESTVRTEGDRVVVDGACDSRWWNHCSVGYEVRVPEDVGVRVRTSNGRITVTGLDGDVDLDSDNGRIDGVGLAGRQAFVRTDNGRVELEFVAAPVTVEVSTDNGSIRVRVPDDGTRYQVDADSDNGAVDRDVPTDPAARHRVTARSANGSIEVSHTPRE